MDAMEHSKNHSTIDTMRNAKIHFKNRIEKKNEIMKQDKTRHPSLKRKKKGKLFIVSSLIKVGSVRLE